MQWLTGPAVAAALLPLLGAGLLLGPGAGAAGTPPHIVMILQDDLGHNDVAFNGGSTLDETANITALARNGIVLTRHYTHWHCSPTRRSFLSGRLPIHHGEQLSGVSTDDLDLRWTIISQKLKQRGYQNYWFGKGHTGYASYKQLPVNRGFDAFTGFLGGSQSYTASDRWEDELPLQNNTEYSTALYGELATQAVQQHDPSTPLFLYLPFQAVHTPYDPVPGWAGEKCAGYPADKDYVYCGMLWAADHWVGQLTATLKAKGMWDNTLIVYSSDNGGVVSGINYPLRGEKHSNWEGGLRVAAFVSGGLIPAPLRGTSNPIVFHIVDWYPTFCRLAGVDGSDDPPTAPLPVDPSDVNKDIYGQDSFPPVDGVDVWDMLMSPGKYNSSSAHAVLPLTKEVLVAGPWKLLVSQPNFKSENDGWKYPNGSWVEANASSYACSKQDGPLSQILPGVPGQLPCLFDVETDVREMWDRAGSEPRLVAELWARLNASILTSFLHGASGPTGNPGGVQRCSPPALLGPCNASCAKAHYLGKQARPEAACTMPLRAATLAQGGTVLRKVATDTAEQCCGLCSSDSACSHFAFNPEDPPSCHIKSGRFDPKQGCSKCFAGSKVAPPSPPGCTGGQSGDFPVCGVPGCT